MAQHRTRVRPLFARPGARYRCFGDGVCCVDLHRLGPLFPREKKRLDILVPGSVVIDPRGGPEMRVDASGACVLLRGGLCGLHVDHGEQAKPLACRRFPYALTATPAGGRVFTSHRCPCRTLGDRPLIDVADAEHALLDNGRLARSGGSPARIAISGRTSASFASYAVIEERILDALNRGEPFEAALDAPARLPDLEGEGWSQVAANLAHNAEHPHRGFQALAWFGDGIRLALGEAVPARARPWSEGFDRAEARSPVIGDRERILDDMLADVIWSLTWTNAGAFDRARTMLAGIGVVVRAITDRLVGLGARSDRAAAEAVLVADVTMAHPIWTTVWTRVRPARAR